MPPGLRIVFAGTPAFAVPALDALIESRHAVTAVYTQPDRPAGRGRRLAASPVKGRAIVAGLPVYQPQTLKSHGEQAAFETLAPDVMVVLAYGLLLPPAMLKTPRLGCINVHASLLPRWRGAAPLQRAILAGDAETGVSIMQMEASLDTGPVLARQATPIAADDTTATLHDRLAALGADTLVTVLDALARGETVRAAPQQQNGITYAAKLEKREARLDWRQPAAALARQVRAMVPWPVAETRLNGTQLRIFKAEALTSASTAAPGTVLAAGNAGIDVAAASGCLRLHEIQRAGRKRVTAAAFARGAGLVGQVLD